MIDSWINIKDKLPDQNPNNTSCLDTDCSVDVFVLLRNGDIEKGCWFYRDNCWTGYNEWDNNEVTHWMPLPKPPKV